MSRINVQPEPDPMMRSRIRGSVLSKICPYCDAVWETKKEIRIADKLFRKNTNCKHTVITDDVFVEESVAEDIYQQIVSLSGKRLYPYQIEGVKACERANFRFLFEDEPGLGKTAQFFAALRLHPEELLPALLVCKAKLRRQLADQSMLWADLPAQIVEANYSKPTIFKKAIVIISYDMIWRVKWDAKMWSKFKTIIIDEVQHMKNPSSKRTKKIKEVVNGNETTLKHIIGASGTPIYNNAYEFFPFLNLVRPDLFPTETGYVLKYVDTYEKNGYRKYGGIRASALERWKEVTSPFIIRRRREDVLPDLPKVDRQYRNCDLAEEVQDAYDKETTDFIDLYGDGEAVGFKKMQNLLAMIARMRHLVGLSKVDDTVEEVEEMILGTDRRVVIFCHHIDVQEVMMRKLMEFIDEHNKGRQASEQIPEPVWLKGGMTDDASYEVIKQFVERGARVMVASTLASGEGVDRLQEVCDFCIFHERMWNPPREKQAEDRLARIGSMLTGLGRNVIAKYMIAVGTIDEWITELVDSKRAFIASTLDHKESAFDEQSLTREMMDIIFQKGLKKFSLR